MSDQKTLQGKSAIVTGASSGIGWATAAALAQRGASVVVTARREHRLCELCDLIAADSGKAVYVPGDAEDEDTAKACVQVAQRRFGAVDILICNAGAGNYKDLVDTSVQEYEALMDANMKSSFLFARFAVPVMLEQKRGDILFISSVAGLQGSPGEAVYCASKFAQVGFAYSLDAELRKHGIKVGVICPGGAKTEFAVGKGRTEEDVRSSRMMDPKEVAEAIVFACTQPPNIRIPQMIVRHMG